LCSADINVLAKEKEKVYKYQPLAKDFHSVYHMKVDIIPIVIGHTGVLSIYFQIYLEGIPHFSNSLLCHLQKAALLGTIHTLQKINL